MTNDISVSSEHMYVTRDISVSSVIISLIQLDKTSRTKRITIIVIDVITMFTCRTYVCT